jgi:hypothetical protein
MKRFFWHKYYEATGAFGRRKDGKLRKDKRNVRLDTEADFWMFMALKKQEAPSGFPDAVSSAHRLKWKKPSVRL